MSENTYNNSTNLVVSKKGSSVIVLGKNRQKDKNGNVQYVRANDRIIIASGVASRENESYDKQITEIRPLSTSAGLIINQSATPSHIFNVDRDPKGFILNAPKNKNYEKLNETETGISTVTVFSDEIQLVSFKNGVNIYTGRRKEKGMIDAGAGVSLIHGNNVEDLEAMVKADKLETQLVHNHKNVQDLQNLVLLNTIQITKLVALMASHTHIATAPGAPVVPSIQGILNGIASAPSAIKSAIDNVAGSINRIIIEINQTKGFESTFHSDYHYLN